VLLLNKATVRQLIGWASRDPETEVCGMVWGLQGSQVVEPLANVHPQPEKYYRTAPKDVKEAFDSMDRFGGEPIAWYHSHPGGKPDPSEEDMAGAMNPGMHYLILYPDAGQWLLSAWECTESGVLLRDEYEVGP
jgi:desampylase